MSATSTIGIILKNSDVAGKSMNELTKQSVALARHLKTLEVGSEEWVKTTEAYKKVNGRLKEVKQEVFATEKAQGLLNSTMGQFIPFNSQISKFIGTYSGIAGSVKNATAAQKLFNLAVAASGIGLLVLAVTALAKAFTTSEEGQNKFAKIMSVINAIIGNGVDLLADLGEKIIWAFENPKKAIEGFAGLIRDQIVNRFMGMLEIVPKIGEVISLLFERKFAEAGQVAADAVGKVALGVENTTEKIQGAISATGEFIKEQEREAKLAAQVADMRAKADLIDRDLMVESAKLQSEINDLKLKARKEDEFSASERKRFLLEAQDLEGQLLDKERESLILRRDAQTMENTFARSNKENLDAEAEAKAAVFQIEARRLEQQRSTQRELNRVNREMTRDEIAQEKEREKNHKEQLKRIEEEKKAREEFILKSIEDELKLNEERKKAGDELLSIYKKQQEEQFNTKMEQLVSMNDAEQRMIDEMFFSNLITQQERDQMLYDSQKTALEERLALMMANGQQTTEEYQNLYMELAELNYQHNQNKLNSDREYQEAKQQLERESLNTASQVFGSLAALLESDEKNRRKNFAAVKAMRLAELSISSFNEIQDIWRYANANPLNALFPGAANIIAIGKTIAASARFAMGVRNINKATFADGGPVFGPSHQTGGIPFSVGGRGGYEMEGNEIILTKGVYQDPVLRTLASDLNVLGGGRSFALGGPVMQDRAMVPTSGASSVQSGVSQASNTQDFREMKNLLIQIERNTRESAEKPPISMTEVRDRLKMLQDVETDAQV